jgi:prepilin-type processing-associated H-X9-DG protein
MTTWKRRAGLRRAAGAFSLIELLIVIGIISLLIGLLAPALGAARRQARSVTCKSQLKNLLIAVELYASENEGAVVPAFNMKGVIGGFSSPFDGWGPILDKGRYTHGNATLDDNPFVCPETLNVPGLAGTQTGTNPDHPRGFMDWPAITTISQTFATPIPRWGFDRIIRVGYWINGDHPVGRPQEFDQGKHFTAAVGYGPNLQGKFMRRNLMSDVVKPGNLIALADGLYSGQQEGTRLGDRDLRIGYRHPGRVGRSNLAFADGHVGDVEGDRFPRMAGGSLSVEEVREENLGPNPTVYRDPRRYLSLVQ